jgi:hypothetical protein
LYTGWYKKTDNKIKGAADYSVAPFLFYSKVLSPVFSVVKTDIETGVVCDELTAYSMRCYHAGKRADHKDQE